MKNKIMEIVGISYNRNNATLIKDIDIYFSDNIDDFQIKENIENAIIFSPNINFKHVWKENVLNLVINSTLEELTVYELYIESSYVTYKKYYFLTGPYQYFTPEFLIKPLHWEIFYRINSNGIVEVYYDHIQKWQFNPCTIAQYALACYDDYISNNVEKSREIFFRQVKYLVENYNMINGAIAYPYYFPFRDLNIPWYSGITQGQIISVMIRAFILTDDRTFLDIAGKIVAFIFVPVKDGGLFTFTPEGYEWIEEYPTEKPSFVLNGFLQAIIGLIEYNKICPNTKLTKHINNFLVTVKKTINLYDTGTGLFYERDKKHECNLLYIILQTYNAGHLFLSTKDHFFKDIYNKWRTYFVYNDEVLLSILYTKQSVIKNKNILGKIKKYIPRRIKYIFKKCLRM